MRAQQQRLAGFAKPHHLQAQQRRFPQIEALPPFAVADPSHLPLSLSRRQPAQLDLRHCHRRRRYHLGLRVAIRPDIARPQDLVALHDAAYRRPQADHRQPLPQPQHPADRVHPAARQQLLDEPQPLLSIRQHLAAAALPAADLRHRPGFAVALQLLDARGHSGYRRRLEQAPQLDLDADLLPHPADHPRRQQRVAAELEEVVAHADRRHPKHLFPDPAHHLLEGTARR